MTKKRRAAVSVTVVSLLGLGCTASTFFGRFDFALVFLVGIVASYFVTLPWVRRAPPDESPE
jgi:hypothetical protein